MRKTISVILLLALFINAGAQQHSSDTIRMSLEDCIDYAFGNNYNRQSMKVNEEVAEDLYQQSKMERLPELSASLSENLNHTAHQSSNWNGSYGLSTNLTLYQGGKINNTIKKQELNSEKASYESMQYDNTLTIQILQAFLNALGNEELLRLQQYLVNVSEQQVREGEVKYKAGQILESDFLLLKAQLASDQRNIVESTINRDNSLMSLKNLLAIDPLQAFSIDFPDDSNIETLLHLLPSEGDFLDRAVNYLPDLKISDYQVDIARLGVKISRAGYYPTLSLNASIGTGHNLNYDQFGNQLSDRFNQQVGLTLSIPIFDKNRTKSSVNQSKFALQQAEFNRKQTELDIRQDIVQEYRNVISARSKYEASVIKQDAYLQSFNVYNVKYREGAITTVDLLQQQNNYISAMNEYIQDKYSFILQRKVLDVYMGEAIRM